MAETQAFFHALAPALTANVLTVVFVYCFAEMGRQERSGKEEGRLTYLWPIVMILMSMLYGLYTRGLTHLRNSREEC